MPARLLHSHPVEELLALLGFVQIGRVTGERMVYEPAAAEVAGEGGAVYVFLNPNGDVWKVGMTRKGFARVDYTRVFDGRAMRRPHEQRKLESIRQEVLEGATQWVVRTDDPERVETLLACIVEPSESGRRRSPVERWLEIRGRTGGARK